jgi:hypothetical protein
MLIFEGALPFTIHIHDRSGKFCNGFSIKHFRTLNTCAQLKGAFNNFLNS